jgi:hypothetical protein
MSSFATGRYNLAGICGAIYSVNYLLALAHSGIVKILSGLQPAIRPEYAGIPASTSSLPESHQLLAASIARV